MSGKANPDGKNRGEIKKEFEIDGINFEKGEPIFQKLEEVKRI